MDVFRSICLSKDADLARVDKKAPGKCCELDGFGWLKL